MYTSQDRGTQVAGTRWSAPSEAAWLSPATKVPAGKRAFDIVVALVLLLVLLPVLITIAVIVKITSRGPALFCQRRVGERGREFKIRKFRTMHTNAEARLEQDRALYEIYIAQDHKIPLWLDPRVTAVGRLLRASSLDELPQLVNVLLGEMSIVGPRPVRPSELVCYGDLLPAYLSVRPGLTGLWQVSGRSDVKFPARAFLDAEYADRFSMGLDFRILLQTPRAIVRGRGAE